MPPEISDNLGYIAIAAAGLYWFWRSNKSKGKPVAVQAAQVAAPVYISSPVAQPDLIDLHIAHQDRREREVKRQMAERKLDQAVLYEDTLKKIGEVLKPPATGSADSPKS